jgi:probable rRNA maturation factor
VSSEQAPDIFCIEANGLAIEIEVAAAANGLDASLAEAIASALSAANGMAGPVRGSLTVVVDDDARIRLLNRQWRGFDKPTNVLSFSYPDIPGGAEKHVGDIAISHETAAREAMAEHKSLRDHVSHLSVHGFLHLLGYDHESDAEAEAMERLERTILARVGVPDPYVAHEAEG